MAGKNSYTKTKIISIIVTLIIAIVSSLFAIDRRYVTNVAMDAHIQLEDQKMKTLAAEMSSQIVDKIMERMEKRYAR